LGDSKNLHAAPPVPPPGNQVKFQISQTEKGAQATNVEVLVPEEEQSFFGEIKSFNPTKGLREREVWD